MRGAIEAGRHAWYGAKHPKSDEMGLYFGKPQNNEGKPEALPFHVVIDMRDATRNLPFPSLTICVNF